MSSIVIWIISLVLVGIPCWRIVSRTGCNRGWIILIVIPWVGIFLFWLVLAVSRWPNVRADVSQVFD
ncbi:MAG: hypothetical protein QF449_07995 [Alphaproteobacteria bacterium]|nr:hypothetical protein [Alphaproteobacteria bacterium]MDP6590020.1 hypothetical protein [Alphaproteobacteria bacterium]MDP6817967.1 hypothetical protein [Alphaproteobacteria bacterium]|tara:strand:- start:1542 stop:1742 length:201 start_codon:yes stop_codon:yes gene_type:complete